jgi:quercetin dioxygenase-like cupin family protein
MRFRGQADEKSPDLRQSFTRTKHDPGLHASKTIDFISVLEGTVILYLDYGKALELAQGSTLVQVGARHSWRAKGPEDAVVAFAILGC